MTKNSSGSTLVEVLVSLVIFVVFFLLSIESYYQGQKAVQQQVETNTRVKVFQGLINIMGMPSTLRASTYNAGPNSDLGKCVYGYYGSCPNPSTIRDLVLLLPPLTSSNGTSADLSGPISGGGLTTPPMLYGLDGSACDPNQSTCPPDVYTIAVTTQWEAVCPPKADVSYFWPNAAWVASDGTHHMNPEGLKIPNYCARAHYIKIHYQFKPADGAPANHYFKTVSGTIMVDAPAANFSY